MTANEKFEIEILKDVSNWSNEKIYSFFGARIEDAFLQEKKKLQALLKKAWENRVKYSFRECGTQLDDNAMLLFFDPKKIKKYKNIEMEEALSKLEYETIFND
jgi:hypothetical protein